MKPSEIFSKNEINKIEKIGILLKDKEYEPPEYRLIESKIEDYIMSASTKNGEISELSNEFSSILTTLINVQK